MLGGGERPAQTVQPAHIGDFVRITDAGGRAMWRDCSCELSGCQQGALDVSMRLDQSWREVLPVEVHLARPAIGAWRADTGDAILIDRDIGELDLVGEDIDQLRVAQHEVRRSLAARHLYQRLPLIAPLPVHLHSSLPTTPNRS